MVSVQIEKVHYWDSNFKESQFYFKDIYRKKSNIMTNEELLEEILTEAHNLGLHLEVMSLSKKKYANLDNVDAYQKALYELKEEYGFTI